MEHVSEAPRSLSDIFDKCFPFYLSIGMSSAEYWDGDPDLVKGFREAYRMRQENLNHEAWLHGLYVYDAVMSALSHLNTKKSSHKDYAEQPYSFKKKSKEEEKVEAEAQAEVWMRNWVTAAQQKFEKK